MPVILVVDDNPQMAELIQEMLTIKGFDAEVAFSGLEGIDKVRDGMPDLLLVDINMPEMNGWQLYHQVREFSAIPVIFVTSDDSNTNKSKAKLIGAEGLVGKDVTPNQLASHIKNVLESQTEKELPKR